MTSWGNAGETEGSEGPSALAEECVQRCFHAGVDRSGPAPQNRVKGG